MMKKIYARRNLLNILLVITLVFAYLSINMGTTVFSASSPSDLINHYDGERSDNFDSGWKFNLGDVSGAQNTSYNDSTWRSLNVPHDWSIELTFNQSSPAGGGGGYLNGGIGWYRKTFTVPSASSGKRVFVQFDGVYMDSTVYINGTSVGGRPYGYSSFEFDLTPYIVFSGSNVLAVRVNNTQPSSRWYSGSGIYRHVWLKTVNPVHVAYCGSQVTTSNVSQSGATVNYKVIVQNQSSSAQSTYVSTAILDANGNTVVSNTSATNNIAVNGSYTFSQTLQITNPQLWSVSSPYLYTVKAQVYAGSQLVDTYVSPLGVRYFTFDANNGFSLNGQAMKLNGVCLHHDLGSLGAAINYRALERQIQIMKAMGCNAIRTSHNPPTPELLDICDRLGLVVMDEAFDCWYTAKNTYDYGRFFNTWAQTDIQGMVTRDRNHPSVVLWSIGNEIPDVADTATAQKLINWVKAMDTTRPITQNMNSVNDNTAAVEDILGFSYGPGNYDTYHSRYPTWKLLGSETSSAVRTRNVYHLPITQNILTASDMQCSSYDNSVVGWGNSAESSWNYINTRNFMSGEFIWTGFDYIGEPTPYGWPAKSSYFGIVDTCGFPKDIYYFYQSKWNYSGPPMVHIVPMDWTNWTNGQTVPVLVYSNCDSVELYLNGSSLGSKTMSYSTAHLQWDVPFAAGTLSAQAKKSGTVVATDLVKTAGAPASIQLSVDRGAITANGVDLAFVEADIVDANGVLVPNASNQVNLSVSGPGAIVGVDNGNPISLESYKGSSRAAFNGKCLAIIQSSGSTGQISVSASSTVVNNIGQKKTASADSEETGKGNVAANGNDGNTSTRWCANDGNTGHWWKVDLGSSVSMTGTQVMWEQNAAYKYKIDISTDNSTWTTKVDKSGNTTAAQTMTDNFTATARYVRVTVTGLPTNCWASLYEFRVLNGSSTINSNNLTITCQNSGATPTPTPTKTPSGVTPTTSVTPTATKTPTATTTVTPSPGSNLALNKPASADSEETGKGNTAAKGNDGSTTTRWCANDSGTGHWWKVDLGSNYNISSTQVMWEFSAAYKYKIDVSTDNSTWTTKVDKSSNTTAAQTMTDTFSATARYVRITVTGLPSGDWASLFEFRVF